MSEENPGRPGDGRPDDNVSRASAAEQARLEIELKRQALKEQRSGLTLLQKCLGIVVVALGLLATYQAYRLDASSEEINQVELQLKKLDLAAKHEQKRRAGLKTFGPELIRFMNELIQSDKLSGDDKESAALIAAIYLIALGVDAAEIRPFLELADKHDSDRYSCFGHYARHLINEIDYEDLQPSCKEQMNYILQRQ